MVAAYQPNAYQPNVHGSLGLIADRQGNAASALWLMLRIMTCTTTLPLNFLAHDNFRQGRVFGMLTVMQG